VTFERQETGARIQELGETPPRKSSSSSIGFAASGCVNTQRLEGSSLCKLAALSLGIRRLPRTSARVAASGSCFSVPPANQRSLLPRDLDAVARFYGDVEGWIGTDFLGVYDHYPIGPQKLDLLLIRG
jgi:hypothetical protein